VLEQFKRLKEVALRQNREADFPDWLLTEVVKIADAPERYAGQIALVETLIAQIADYASYAGAGCFDDSVGAETIQRTLKAITGCGEGPASDTGDSAHCPLLPCCQLFAGMKDMPRSAEYIQSKLCHGEYDQCNRHKMYRQMVGEKVDCFPNLSDVEEVEKVMQCLLKKQSSD